MRLFPNLLAVIALFASVFQANAQQVERKRLMRNINVPLKSHIFPSLSGDGLFMIFYSDYSNTGKFELKYSEKTGYEFWEEAKYVENLVKPRNDHFGSYCLSYDGRQMYFSSYRASGIGKYDIWFTERKGNYWSAPKNPGKPLNSPGNDGNPCLSPDGRSIYFMRCETMDAKGKENCKIYVARKISETRWGEPEALPAKINAYHSTTPRILIDNETLIYSSQRPEGKGRLDLYMTKKTGNGWSDPLPLDFINSVRNDEFVSVPARGDLIYYTDVYKDQHNIYKAILPEAMRPKKVLLITGKVSFADGKDISEAILIQTYDAGTGALVSSVKPNENTGDFFLALPAGKVYDFSVFPKDADHTYYSAIYDLSYMENPKWEKLELSLEPINLGAALNLSTINFDKYNNISENSAIEFRRLKALMQKNPYLNMEVGVYVDSVVTDSIPRLGLNKAIADTTFFVLNKVSLFENGESFGPGKEDSLSALGYLFLEDKADSTIYYKLKYTYTNDDTQEKAAAIVNELIRAGLPPEKLLPMGYGADSDSFHEDEETHGNYRVEIRLY